MSIYKDNLMKVQLEKQKLYAELRKLYQQEHEIADAESDLLIKALHMTINNPMTAKQISEALNGALNKEEIARNFGFAPISNSYRINEYAHKKFFLYFATCDGFIRFTRKKEIKYFAQVNEYGEVIGKIQAKPCLSSYYYEFVPHNK